MSEGAIAQAVIDLNSGDWADLRFRYADPDNYYAARIGADTGGGSGPVDLIKMVRGKESTVDSTTYSTASTVTVKVKVTASDEVEIWVDGTSKIVDTNGLDIAAGGVALAGEKAVFDDVKVGYDNTADDDIDDGADDLVIDENFSGTTMTPTHAEHD